MNNDPKLSNKKILSDPAAEYIRLIPENDKQSAVLLAELGQKYNLLKKQHKALKAAAKGLSRQIGETKRGGGSIDALLLSMQEQTSQISQIEEQLGESERQILAYFNDPSPHFKTASIQTDSPSGREYPTSYTQPQDIAVDLLGDSLEAWNDYVHRNPAASTYHRAEWRELIRQTFGHECYYFTARDKHRSVVGILPLVRLKSRLFGDFMVSMPYFNYGGAIADDPAIELQLMKTADDHAGEMGLTHVEYRDDIPHESYPVRSDKVNMILGLPETVDELWNQLGSKVRSQIKRPQKHNPQVLSGREEHLDDFYTVFSRNMRDLGTPVYGKTFFRNILRTFPEESCIISIRLGNRPVAAGFLIGHGETLEIPWASTIREANPLSVNMLLYWSVLKFAVENGYRRFDFGRSSKDAGTYRFKQQWGAVPKQLYWHYWLNAGCSLPSLTPQNPKYALAINLWKHLPLIFTNWLGPYIVRNLP